MASDRCWKPVTSYLASSSGGKNLMHVGASSEVWLCFFEMSWKFLFFWNVFEVSGDKASDSFCMVSGSCWLVHVSKVLDWDSDWFLIHGALSFLKGAANWKGSHWILKFLNDQLIKFEVLLIGFCYQWILWSMVFCSILQSMVRSELFHPVAFCHGFWWSCWSTSFW